MSIPNPLKMVLSLAFELSLIFLPMSELRSSAI